MLDAHYGNDISQRRYLGSKKKLLKFIEDILLKEKVKFDSFADIFSGTGVVASNFYKKSNVILNDILGSNVVVYDAFFGRQILRKKIINNKINYYNSLDAVNLSDNYFSKNFSNTYFDKKNSKIIGFIRDDIEKEYKKSKLNKRERSYLISSLVYAADRIANTVGHYDAYRKIKIPNKKLILNKLNIQKSPFSALIFNEDANDLVKRIESDVVYIDPPYNSRQYSDCYHLLENIVEWKKEKVLGVAKKIDRSKIKSKYSSKSAGSAFSDLIKNIKSKYILVSYNDMGMNGSARSQSLISDNEIISALEMVGDVKIYEKDFKQFTTGSSTNDSLKERIFFCKINKNKKHKKIFLSEKNTHLPEYLKSPLNYTGGKHKIISQISKKIPDGVGTFYDVFCGGGNVGINVNSEKIICIDNDSEVVKLLNLIKNKNFEELNIEILDIIKKFDLSQSYINGYNHYGANSSSGLGSVNKEKYSKLRDFYNKNSNNSIYLLTLIFYSFNNQIRFNSKGEFNMPVGKRDYNGNSRKNLSNFNYLSNKKKINFKKMDFRKLVNIDFKKNDFVYLDPPYLLGLASYNESRGWTEKDENDLYEVILDLNNKGVKFALSNVINHKGKTHKILKEFSKKNGFKIHNIKHNYNNSNYQSKNKNNETKEVLITNY